MARGKLRIYLGAAPGVGKTFAMLSEGRRAKARGTDAVVGLFETHGRPQTAAQVGDLEVIPRKTIEYRGKTFEEMDVDAVLRRKPQRVLVDEIAGQLGRRLVLGEHLEQAGDPRVPTRHVMGDAPYRPLLRCRHLLPVGVAQALDDGGDLAA